MARRKRAPNQSGRLFKRKSGRSYPANAPLKAPFYLTICRDGKRVTLALKDENGNPITDRQQAEQERGRLTLPSKASGEIQRVETLAGLLHSAHRKLEQANGINEPLLTLANVWDAYLSAPTRRDTAPRTLQGYESYWNAFRSWLATHEPSVVYFRDITPEMAEKYAGEFRRSNASGTYNKHMTFLKSLFQMLAKTARLNSNPFKELQRLVETVHPRRELTLRELKTIMEQATGEMRVLFAIGAFTGLRLGDAATLQWQEVDMERRIIRRVPNKTRRRRQVPVKIGIADYLYTELNAILTENRQGPVLPTCSKLYENNRTLLCKRIQQHFKACGIQTAHTGTGTGTGKRAQLDVGFHSLRHTFVSVQAERGTPQVTVQQIVGHGSPAMTLHYSHTSDEAAIKAAEVFDDIVNEVEHPTPSKYEPLPAWAKTLIDQLDAKNVHEIKKMLLGSGV